MASDIIIKGARVHNLKNISLTLPRDKFIVFTGLSGSGKSSLAFDTIYAEGHRRFVESLSSYARMFLGQLDKPDVDSIEGLSPAISIDQKTTSKNPRSTVGTVDRDIRLSAAFVRAHRRAALSDMRRGDKAAVGGRDSEPAFGAGGRRALHGAGAGGQREKGMHEKVFEDAAKSGYVRVRVDGSMYDLSEKIQLDKNIKHSIDIVVDRLVMQKPGVLSRLTDSIETASSLSGGMIRIVHPQPRRQRGGDDIFPELRLQDPRYLARRACAAHVLVQQPVRRVSGL